MSIKISESEIRSVVRSSLIKEGLFSSARRKGEGDASGTKVGKEKYEGPLVTEKDGKRYIGDPNIGLSPSGFWEGFRKRLQDYINENYDGPRPIEMRIENLGVTRDLEQAADTGGNTARAAGSKHGCGMAQDVYMHTAIYGEYTNFRTMNEKLAKNQKLVNTIIDFMSKSENSDLQWGGTFGSGTLNKGSLPTGRGILEFHHFEFKGARIPSFFKKYEEELEKVGMKSAQLNNLRSLKELYLSLV